MKPLGNNVLLAPEQEETEQKTEAGIITLEQNRPIKYGTIIGISPDIKDPQVKIGDRVIYGSGAGTPFGTDLILRYESLIAIV